MTKPNLQVGDHAPDFTGITTDGSRVALNDYRGKNSACIFT